MPANMAPQKNPRHANFAIRCIPTSLFNPDLRDLDPVEKPMNLCASCDSEGYRLYRLRKNSMVRAKMKKSIPQGLKPTLVLWHSRHD